MLAPNISIYQFIQIEYFISIYEFQRRLPTYAITDIILKKI